MWVSQVTKVTCLFDPVGISRHYLCILDYNHPRKTLTQTCTHSHTLEAALINGLWSFNDATPGKPVNMLYEARACYCYLLLCSLHGSILLTSRLLFIKKRYSPFWVRFSGCLRIFYLLPRPWGRSLYCY